MTYDGTRPESALDAFRCAIGSCVVDRTALCAAKASRNAPRALVGRVRVPAVRLATLGRNCAHKRLGLRLLTMRQQRPNLAGGGRPIVKVSIGCSGRASAFPLYIVWMGIGAIVACVATDAQLRQHWPRPLATVGGGGGGFVLALHPAFLNRSALATVPQPQPCNPAKRRAAMLAQSNVRSAGGHRRQATLPTLAAAMLAQRNALRPSCERAMLSVAAASLWPLGSAPAAGWQAHWRPRRLPAARRCERPMAPKRRSTYDKRL